MSTGSSAFNNRSFWAITALVLLVALLVVVRSVDWGGDSGLGTVPVSITLLQDGEPVPDVLVTLSPLPHTVPIRSAAGTTGANGRCQMTTLKFDDGAMPGPYAVGVERVPAWTMKFHDEAFLDVDPGSPSAGTDPSQIGPMAMYSTARREEAKTQPRELPKKLRNPKSSGMKATIVADQPNNFAFDIEEKSE